MNRNDWRTVGIVVGTLAAIAMACLFVWSTREQWKDVNRSLRFTIDPWVVPVGEEVVPAQSDNIWATFNWSGQPMSIKQVTFSPNGPARRNPKTVEIYVRTNIYSYLWVTDEVIYYGDIGRQEIQIGQWPAEATFGVYRGEELILVFARTGGCDHVRVYHW